MKFIQHYSGSTANLYELVSASGRRLLIDPGVQWPRLLTALDHDLSNIDGGLVSHGHKDHCRGLRGVLRAGIKTWTGYGTFDTCGLGSFRGDTVKVIQNGAQWRIGDDFEVLAFDTNHDAPDPLGFVILADGEDLLFATDTSHIRQRFSAPFDIVAIECSYDQDILRDRVDSGDINETLAKRLLNSHMERESTLRYLLDHCDLSRCREIHLLHLSRDNIEAESTRATFQNDLSIETIICGHEGGGAPAPTGPPDFICRRP